MSEPVPPSPDFRLRDPSRRAELLRKVEALLSVLEVTQAKVLGNLSRRLSAAEESRLRRMRRQVENTLKVCRRARTALRGGSPISSDEILGTDIDALCRRLADHGERDDEAGAA